MSDHEYAGSGMGSDDQASEAQSTGHRPMSFDCCGVRMDEDTTGCACGSIMKRHPFVTFAIGTVMGLALLVIPAGAILGILAFLRTI